MLGKKPVLLFSAILIFTQFLSGCATHEPVQGAYPQDHQIVTGAATGAVGGFAVGKFMGFGAPAGAAVGSIVGSAIGFNEYKKALNKQKVQIIKLGQEVTIILPTDNFFEVGTPTLRFDSYPALEGITGMLKGYGNVPITVTGYSDNIGNKHYQNWIAKVQAQSIAAYLWSHGIPLERITINAKGADAPVATSLTVAGAAANRRIEITLREAVSTKPYLEKSV